MRILIVWYERHILHLLSPHDDDAGANGYCTEAVWDVRWCGTSRFAPCKTPTPTACNQASESSSARSENFITHAQLGRVSLETT